MKRSNTVATDSDRLVRLVWHVCGASDLPQRPPSRSCFRRLRMRLLPAKPLPSGVRSCPRRKAKSPELAAARTTAEAPRRPSDGTAAPLRLIVREDFAILYVGQRFGDFVGVDGGNELGQLA